MNLPKIPLAGVIGSPIAHSKSPQLHRHWLKTYGIEGYYIPMDVVAQDLEDVVRTLPKMGFVGVNVTIPHKEAILSFVIDGIHPHDLGTLLDRYGIAVRTGHHCTQPLMERFGAWLRESCVEREGG